jgi:hypothetical protein
MTYDGIDEFNPILKNRALSDYTARYMTSCANLSTSQNHTVLDRRSSTDVNTSPNRRTGHPRNRTTVTEPRIAADLTRRKAVCPDADLSSLDVRSRSPRIDEISSEDKPCHPSRFGNRGEDLALH